MGARWYDPAAGDFTSRDTVTVSPDPDPAAGNPFAYAADEPLDFTDPTGHYIVPPGNAASDGVTPRIGSTSDTSSNNYVADVAAARVIQAAEAKATTSAAKAASAKAAAAKVTAEQNAAAQKAAAEAKKAKAAKAKQQQKQQRDQAAAKARAQAAVKASLERAVIQSNLLTTKSSANLCQKLATNCQPCQSALVTECYNLGVALEPGAFASTGTQPPDSGSAPCTSVMAGFLGISGCGTANMASRHRWEQRRKPRRQEQRRQRGQ